MNTLKTYIQEADAVERTAGRIRRTLIMARVTLVGSDRISDSLTSSLPHFYPLLLSPGSPLPPSLPPSPSSLTLACTHLETSTSLPLRLSLQNSSHFSSSKIWGFVSTLFVFETVGLLSDAAGVVPTQTLAATSSCAATVRTALPICRSCICLLTSSVFVCICLPIWGMIKTCSPCTFHPCNFGLLRGEGGGATEPNFCSTWSSHLKLCKFISVDGFP